MKRFLAGLMVAVLAIGMLAGCAKNDAGEQPAEETLTREFEGVTLNVMLAYGGAENSFAAFTEKTGINIEYVEISTGKALAKLQAEDGNTTTDVWFGGGVDSYITATELGYLEQYKSPEAEKINPTYSDKDGYWTGLALVPAGFLVNNDILAEKGLEAPKTWEDLANPIYKDEIIMASPAISGTQYAILNGLIQQLGEEAGWDLFQRINENVDVYAKSGGEPGPKVSAGEYAIGVLAITGGTYALEQKYPVTTVAPEDYIPWTPAPIAIFKSSQNKEAAKVFVDYMLSEEGQLALREADARIMAREDVAVPEVMQALDTSKLINQDVLLFGSQREAMLEKWAALAGEKDA